MTAPEQMRACPTPWCSHDCTPYTWQGPSDHYTVICEECQVEGPYCATESDAIAAWNTRPAPAELVEAQWQPIETAPEGNEETGPFFDVIWAGKNHRYLPVPARQIDCYRKRGSIKKQHGYPAVTTVFLDKPTHWMPRPDAPAALRNAGAAS